MPSSHHATRLWETSRSHLKRFSRSLGLSTLLTRMSKRFLWNTGTLFQVTITWCKYILIPQLLLVRRTLKYSLVRAQLPSLKLHNSILEVIHSKGLMKILQDKPIISSLPFNKSYFLQITPPSDSALLCNMIIYTSNTALLRWEFNPFRWGWGFLVRERC